jgi:hypothetical protein
LAKEEQNILTHQNLSLKVMLNADKKFLSLHLGHIILIPTQPVVALTNECWMHSREATNSNFIVFGFDPTWDQTHDLPHSR